MPNISVYLKDETLEAIHAKSKIEHMPLSTIIREAVEQYLGISESKEARNNIYKTLSKEKPLGEWEEYHKGRTLSDVCRG